MNYAKKENDMPIDEFEKLGLYENGVFHLSSEDLEALKRGRRTSMITLRNFNIDGFSVSSIDAKVSLRKNSQGEIKINIHPIYREPQLHPLLDDNEQQSLIEGKKQFIRKQVEAKRDKKENVIIEYDRSTREFVTYFPSQVTAPIKVNNEELTRAQQLDFCNGEVVTLKDGTRIQHSASDNKGVRSDNQRLIVSVLLDGGISYLIFRGILNLKGHFQRQSNGYSEGYNQAMTEMILADKRKINDKIGLNFEQASNDAPQTRSYGHPFPR